MKKDVVKIIALIEKKLGAEFIPHQLGEYANGYIDSLQNLKLDIINLYEKTLLQRLSNKRRTSGNARGR